MTKANSVFSGTNKQVNHLNSSPSKPGNILDTQSQTNTVPNHAAPHPNMHTRGGGDISSFLDESHVQLDQSIVGIDNNDYMDDMSSQ